MPDTLKLKNPHVFVKFAPLSIIDIDPTIQFAAEYFFNRRFSLQQEVGYGKFGNMWWIQSFENQFLVETWRFRTEGRYYFVDDEYSDFSPYVALEILFKNADRLQRAEVDRGGYREIIDFRFRKRVWGSHIKIGTQFLLGSRFIIDAYLGLGYRHIKVRTVGISAEEYSQSVDVDFFQRSVGNYPAPSVSLGFKVGYAFMR
ncbi:MAG: DUF3575 domain-containing protein [Verrucomicrobia bacterium]|nr:DUF3575 domain-containing protein [Cytophagales bacterium]